MILRGKFELHFSVSILNWIYAFYAKRPSVQSIITLRRIVNIADAQSRSSNRSDTFVQFNFLFFKYLATRAR